MSAVEMRRTLPENFSLARGSHDDLAAGACLMEAVAYVTGDEWTDAPRCASPVLTTVGQRLNDRLGDVDRQRLLPLVYEIPGTAGDGWDESRRWMALDWAVRVSLPTWLDAAGRADHAESLRALPPIVDGGSWSAARLPTEAARSAARTARYRAVHALRGRVAAEVQRQGAAADIAFAADIAAAGAVAAAVAAAVADAAHVAADATAAAAAAAAVAVAVAAAVADAAHVAADATAAAAADAADADADVRMRVYRVVRERVERMITDGDLAAFSAAHRVTTDGAIDLYARMVRIGRGEVASHEASHVSEDEMSGGAEMSVLRWEEPPAAQRGRVAGKWQTIIDELRSRPGQWAVVAEDANIGIAGYLKTRYGVETTSRGRGSDSHRSATTYARWPAGSDQ